MPNCFVWKKKRLHPHAVLTLINTDYVRKRKMPKPAAVRIPTEEKEVKSNKGRT